MARLTSEQVRAFWVGFHAQVWAGVNKVVPHWQKYCRVFPSTSSQEVFHDFSETGKPVIWTSDRIYHGYTQEGMTVVPYRREYSFKIGRDELEDGKMGQIMLRSEQLGEGMEVAKNRACFDLLNYGINRTVTYKTSDGTVSPSIVLPDDQPLFSLTHKVLGAKSDAVPIPNYIPKTDAGTAPPWYLVSTTQSILPLLLTDRSPKEFASFDKATDIHVFEKNEFLMGMTERYGTHPMSWQTIVRCGNKLTPANLAEAFKLFAEREDRYGVQQMAMPDTLLIPAGLLLDANYAVNSDYTFTNGTISSENLKMWRSMLKIDAVPYLLNRAV